VGQLGANDANKGTTHLVQAVAALNEGRPEGDPVRLVLAGPVSPSFQEFRESLPVEHGRWLTVLGSIPDADRADFFAAIDTFAMPSRTDSFGIVFLEAWANAKPVVAAASGGVAEVVENGRTGVLIPYGSVTALREALQGLLDDPGLAARLGHEGARKVARGYSWDDRFATLAAALDDCLRDGGRPIRRAILPAARGFRRRPQRSRDVERTEIDARW
jgi:glycosyltransferase involved in cell wall biosynthesis